jgi:hypothetical protein
MLAGFVMADNAACTSPQHAVMTREMACNTASRGTL